MLDAVLQLPHVTWPVVAHEHVNGGGTEAENLLPVFQIHLADKVICQKENVRFALRQVGQVNLEDVQAVKEVFAEAALLDEAFQVLARARDDADVCALDDVAPLAAEAAVLNELQQFCLRCGGKVRHFVQEEGPAACLLCLPDVPAHGAGEGAALVPEQLALEGIAAGERAERVAVQNHEGLLFAVRKLMDGAGGVFLAGAGVPAQ